jgi:hypothetical protein
MADAGARAALSAAAPGSMAAYAPDRVLDLWDDAISGRTGSQAAKGRDDG